MKQLSVSDFEARASEVIRQVQQTGKAVELTRHGKPVAVVETIASEKPVMGKLAHMLVHAGDVISPVVGPDDWEANR